MYIVYRLEDSDWAEKMIYQVVRMAIITLGVTVFTVTPVFAFGKVNTKRVFNGTAQMTVTELKSLQAEKEEAGADKDYSEVKRYLNGEVAYFYDKSRSDKKDDTKSETEAQVTEAQETDKDENTGSIGQEAADSGKTENEKEKSGRIINTGDDFLNSKADYASDSKGTMQIDPEETLTKEQEEEVLDTTEIVKYVSANYSVLQQFTNESEYTTKARQAVVSYAMQFIGNPYVWGGTSLTNGADCSGFVQEIFRHFGIVTGRTSRDQYANCVYLKGKEVMPGDLIFYADETGYINHVAIYAGNYMIVHAANRKAGIKVNRYDYKQPYAYGRFIAN